MSIDMYQKGLGIPYMGSKRKIAKELVDYMFKMNPQVDTVYDLFGGGGAMTFEFAQRPQIKKVIYNDADSGVVSLMRKVLEDGVTDEFYEWIDRDTFHELKNDNSLLGGFTRTCWSFGNRASGGYIYNSKHTDIKRLLHEIIVNSCGNSLRELERKLKQELDIDLPTGMDNRRKTVSDYMKELGYPSGLYRSQFLERMCCLVDIARLDDNIKSKIELNSKSAFDFNEFQDNALIYLDPPYIDTKEYINGISHEVLYDYIENIDAIVYLSSYESPLYEVMGIKKQITTNTDKTKTAVEKLFCNRPETMVSSLERNFEEDEF